MKVVPIGNLRDEYDDVLSHIEPDPKTSNLVMIKYPGYWMSTLFNMRDGGGYRVSMRDKNDKPFSLEFNADGLAPLHDLERKKCGW